MKRFLAVVVSVLLLSPLATRAAAPQTVAQQQMSKLQWRSIGPSIGGRVVAVAGVPSERNVFYMGGVEGGVWKSTDYGVSWQNISDGKLPRTATSIGALAVAPSNANVMYAGTGESDIRSDFDTGVGVFRSANAGKTWQYAGLRDTHTTMALAVDPHNADVVYAASMGHVFKPNAQRGVYKTTDGGKTWRKVLFVNDKTGAVDLAMDPRHPQVLYAAMWQAQRVPWNLTSGGPGSGLYKTTDGGAHWTNISKNAGFARGILGKIGVSVAPSDPNVVYAIVQARHGGVFRSNNGGASWKRVNREMKLRQRAFYYMAIFADPRRADTVYAPNVDAMWMSHDGGVHWQPLHPPHGDNHTLWIDPHDTNVLLEGNDGGATVSTDGGKTWSSEHNQPTGQFYHVILDRQFPFDVFGAQQDEGSFEGPSSTTHGSIALADWHGVALGESTFIAPDPSNPNVTFGSGYYSALARLDDRTGQLENVSPWPPYLSGASSAQLKYRFAWTRPVLFSPADPRELLVGAQVVFSSTDEGNTWKILSPDLTRNDKRAEGPSGGPVDLDQTGAETFPTIAVLAVSPLNKNLLWAGSSDGLVHITTDHGAHWKLVTPPSLPQWARITSIEPSRTSAQTAYLSASRFQWDDFHPYIYKTTDGGAHWSAMAAGIPGDQYVYAVRQDPREPSVLFAGTRSTAYVSLDGGAAWQPLTLNLPGVQVRDLAIDARQGELVAATHGRSFWILDNLALLEQLAREQHPALDRAQLFTPETAWLSHAYGAGRQRPNAGENAKYGAAVFFQVPRGYDGKTPVSLSFFDAHGNLVRSFALHLKQKHPKKPSPAVIENFDAVQQRAFALKAQTAIDPGMNVFQWDMRYAPATDIPGWRTLGTDDFPDNGDGPTIVPGAYAVVLQYGARKISVPLRVELDPRIHPGAGDLNARLALEMQIRNTIDRFDTVITAAMADRRQLPAGARVRLDRELATLVQMNNHSSEADAMHRAKLRAQLGFLNGSLEDAYARPTPADYRAYRDLRAAALRGERQLHVIMRK